MITETMSLPKLNVMITHQTFTLQTKGVDVLLAFCPIHHCFVEAGVVIMMPSLARQFTPCISCNSNDNIFDTFWL
jgi:hypothetical protein